MPEIGEGRLAFLHYQGFNAYINDRKVARVVHYIGKNLVGKTLAKVVAEDDGNVFGKVGTSGNEVMKALTGKKILDAKRQGKYFWMVMSSPPHLLMHFGMAGWFKFRNEETFYYKPSKEEDPEWPPKYWKFHVETAEEPKCEAAFVDFRRFSRIRLVDCAAEDIRNVSPLADNGPDPVIDKDVFTEQWLGEKLGSKKIPVKALLLDQGNISGIGNWVGDEILYDARIHPEQYSNTLNQTQVKQLYKSIQYVCGFAVEHLADSTKFPEEWLFKHRWGKGKKDTKTTLPNGSRFVFLTVGGRTSCVVPSVQKKTGPVAKDVEDGNGDEDDKESKKTAKSKVGKKTVESTKDEDGETESEPTPKPSKSRKRGTKQEDEEPAENGVIKNGEPLEKGESKPASKKRKSNSKAASPGMDAKLANQKNTKSDVNGVKKENPEANSGRRRSTRVSGKDT